MSYCEFKPEEMSSKFLTEKEPPVGEWNGEFLVSRVTDISNDA